MKVLGPLFRYELTRMARRGLQPRLRALFAVLLLVALFVTYLGAFPGANPVQVLVSDIPLPIKDAAGFAERFFVAFLIVQLVVVCLITPPITGGAMAEEKERGSLDFLLSSPLTNWEIVVGKLAARLVFVAGVVLTGMPVLMFTLFFGGVDPGRLLIGYGITLMTAFSLSAFSLFCAVVSSGLRPTLLWSYSAVVGLTVFGFMCCCLVVPIFFSPFSTLYFLLQADSTPFGRGGFLQQEVMLFGFTVIHGLVGAIFFGVSVAKVRIGAPVRYFDPRTLPRPPAAAPRPAGFASPLYPHGPDPLTAAPPERQPPPLPVPARVLPAVAIAPAPPPRPAYVPVGPRRWRRVPPVRDDNPMVWKERYFGGRIWPHWDSPWHALAITLLAVGASALGLVMLPITLQGISQGSLGQYWGPVARFFYAATLPLAMLGAAVVTSGSITGERQRQTLLSLLTLPGRRHEIVSAKLWAGMRAVWLTSVVAFGSVVIALFTGYLSVPGAVVGLLIPVPWVFAAAAYGLWMSVRCSTSARATGAVLVSLLALALVPPMAGSLAADILGGGPEAVWAQGVFNGTSPPVAAWTGLTPWDEWTRGPTRGWSVPLADTGGVLGGAVLAALFGALFWLRARHEFENEGRH